MGTLLWDMSVSQAMDELWVTVSYWEGILAGNAPLQLGRSRHNSEGESFPVGKGGKQENEVLSYELTRRVSRKEKLSFFCFVFLIEREQEKERSNY